MKRIKAALSIWCLLLLTSISAAAISPQERKKIQNAMPEKAPAAARRARKLLVFNKDIWDGVIRKGHASIPYGNLAIEMMGRKTKAYETVVSSDIAMFRPENIRQFDAICFNNTTGVLFEDARLKKSLLDFISGGKGFIGIHAAAATFVQWPKYDQWQEFGEMLGAYENGGHPWKYNEWINIKLDEPRHPLNAAFKGKGFRISDEVFQFQKPYTRNKLRVLLSIDMKKTEIISGRRILPERQKDKDFAVSWIHRYGKGRVFYSFLGHNPQTCWNPPILQHYLAGIQFALGDLPVDATPSNKTLPRKD
ncbi:MAG: ThuA domain-containing protein [Planctomycetes bacterium]|nr:ThuA domain-containing protein [Planctomycetota bacterium]